MGTWEQQSETREKAARERKKHDPDAKRLRRFA